MQQACQTANTQSLRIHPKSSTGRAAPQTPLDQSSLNKPRDDVVTITAFSLKKKQKGIFYLIFSFKAGLHGEIEISAYF